MYNSGDVQIASVQRANPEMQRRCQEVIDQCWARGEGNPILFIHDVGAGGLSNALPELVKGGGRGGRFELRKVPSDERGMSPMEIWCNESQERYVLAVAAARLAELEAICERERCPFAVVGEATGEEKLVLGDAHFGNTPIDMPISVLFGKPPRMLRDVARLHFRRPGLDLTQVSLPESISSFRILGPRSGITSGASLRPSWCICWLGPSDPEACSMPLPIGSTMRSRC